MDKNHIQFVFEHVMARLDLMESGQVTDCEGLFDPELWNSVSPSEHRHVFVPPNIHAGGTGQSASGVRRIQSCPPQLVPQDK